VLFTDGVHEAYNESGEEYGLDRVREVILTQLGQENADVPTAIVADVQQFISPALPADDICIVAIEVTANRPASNVGPIAEQSGKR